MALQSSINTTPTFAHYSQKAVSLYIRNTKIEYKILLNLNSLITFETTMGAHLYTCILSFPHGTGPVHISCSLYSSQCSKGVFYLMEARNGLVFS